jgi:ubiquitin-conjugating enzyme E2 M
MIRKQLEKKITTIKQEKEDRANNTSKKKEGVDYRLEKDLAELDLKDTMCTLIITDKENLREFVLRVQPKDGYFVGGTFDFTVNVPTDYPHQPPKVLCKSRVFHPNIDEQGNVCLNILREDWRPVLTLKAVVYGLQLLFIEPNPDDPLNKDAAKVFREDKQQFQRTVQKYMRGTF